MRFRVAEEVRGADVSKYAYDPRVVPHESNCCYCVRARFVRATNRGGEGSSSKAVASRYEYDLEPKSVRQ